MSATTEVFLATGGNRQSSAADWGAHSLVFGAGNNVALWAPENLKTPGVSTILKGHTDVVNAVRVWYTASYGSVVVSGSSDRTVRIWRVQDGVLQQWLIADAHEASINTISVQQQADTFVTGGADSTVRIWQIKDEQLKLVQTISLKPKLIPLTTALIALEDSTVLAVAGTSNTIQIFVRTQDSFELQAVLPGHEGWIRSLDFGIDTEHDPHEIVLASASQDKYIRLWRMRRESTVSTGSLLSNKIYTIKASTNYSLWYDALLVGHEDWICTVRWNSTGESLRLLSASADNSLAIWSKESSGLWLCTTRLGEISSHKGGTTATGSTGGFWIGLWGPDAKSVVSLGRTGSWRRWMHDAEQDSWTQDVGISGHIKEVQQVSWSPDGTYLLTTSSDQTTRMFAEWKREGLESWHEVGRPQIHGYDLNCVAALTGERFVSGAEEKLLRVFDKPRIAGHLLSHLSGQSSDLEALPDTAAIPVLGLSNKIVEEAEDDTSATKPTLDLSKPPNEDFLSRHTLWPEHEKLYGHGYEISALAVAPSATIIATACKASTLDHAVIRLFETETWREVKPALTAHNLTITSLAFSHDSEYLLSVSRDRQWALFRKEGATYISFHINPKGHSRMILDCSWAADRYVFATAGRDKTVKLWQIKDDVEQIATITASAAVTAVAFLLYDLSLVYGTEEGELVVVNGDQSTPLNNKLCPSKAITSLAWRPGAKNILAVASEDTTVRILHVA